MLLKSLPNMLLCYSIMSEKTWYIF